MDLQSLKSLGANTNKIHCRRDYIQKIRFKHHIPAHNLWIIQPTIELGLVVQCENHKLTFIAFHEPHAKFYEASIKVTQERHEIWLETFHRTKPREVHRKMRKYPIIRRE